MTTPTKIADLKPKQQQLITHLQPNILLQAIHYAGGEEAVVKALLQLEKLPEDKRAASVAPYAELARQLAKTDLYFLAAYVLENAEVLDDFHKEMCEPSGYWDENGNRIGADHELDLWPREHMKSTVLTEARSVQFILQNPDIRILIVNEILSNAETFLAKIKRYFERSENIKYLFGNWVGSQKWNVDSMTVSARHKNLKEPTVTIGALGHQPVSQHYDVIIADDVVGRSNTGTPDQMAKVEQFFRDIEDLLDKEHGLLSIIGTRWHYNDYYGKVIAKFSGRANWRIRKHSIYRDDGSILFPKRFKQQKIEDLKELKGPYEFNCQYMLEPVSAEDADFRQEWWDGDKDGKGSALYSYGLQPPKLTVAITCDPASSNKHDSDYTVFMVVGADNTGCWWILDMIRARLDPQERVDTLFNLYAKWKYITPYIKVGIETVGFQQTLKFYAEGEMRSRNLYFQITDLKPKNAQKEDRIRSLVPRFAQGTLKIPDHLWHNGEDLTQTLKDEFLYFPKAKHDDMMDCLAYVNQIMPPSVGGSLQSGVPSSAPSSWVVDLLKGRTHWKMVAAKTGLGKEDIDAITSDYLARMGVG